jgi:hypothetical protein
MPVNVKMSFVPHGTDCLWRPPKRREIARYHGKERAARMEAWQVLSLLALLVQNYSSAYVGIREHASAYAALSHRYVIRQHTSAHLRSAQVLNLLALLVQKDTC